MGFALVTAATSDPLDASEVASEILDWQANNANLAMLEQRISEATLYVQEETARQFMQATYVQTWDDWPDAMKLDIRPISSITSVKYYDADGTLTTVIASDYWFDRYASRSMPDIVFKPSFSWPVVELWRPSAVQVTFVAGYASAAVVPATAKLAIRQLAMYWYNQRQAVAVSDSVEPAATRPAFGELPFGVRQAIAQLNASGYT